MIIDHALCMVDHFMMNRIVPFAITTLEGTYQRFRGFYISEMNKGEASFDKLYAKVVKSNKMKELLSVSVHNRAAPKAGDLIYMANTMPAFFFKFDFKYVALISLVLLREWNSSANRYGDLATEEHVNYIVHDIFEQLSKNVK